jgi:hypothetical protein
MVADGLDVDETPDVELLCPEHRHRGGDKGGCVFELLFVVHDRCNIEAVNFSDVV